VICSTGVTKTLRSTLAALLACCSATVVHAQTFNVYEGYGVLENGWQDWSWASDSLASTAYIYQNQYSAAVTYTAGYQAFWLMSSGFPASYFTGLSFYINGGATAGRTISVVLTLNGGTSSTPVNLNRFVTGGSVASNAWNLVNIPLTAFGVKTTDKIDSIQLQEASGAAQPTFYVSNIGWTPKSPPSTVPVAVNPLSIVRKVDQKMFGVNTAWWGDLTNASVKSLISQGGYKAFRWPGGSSADGYNWQTETLDFGSGSFQFPHPNTDDFATATNSLSNGQSFITTNYGSGTAALAASWVQYTNKTHNYGFKYWEVGNEVYGTWEYDTHAKPNDPVTYAQQFQLFSNAMKAVDPTVKVCAVVSPGEDAFVNYHNEVVTNPVTKVTHSGWTAVMLSTMKSLGVQPDAVIYHRYPQYLNDSDFLLMINNSGWAADFADIRMQLNDYLGTNSVRIMCDENNADSGAPSKQLTSVVNGVYLADSFGSILQTECDSYVWWDLINGQDSSNTFNGPWLYGWRTTGDEGTIYQPQNSNTFLPYPTYHIGQVLSDFTQPGDNVVSATSSYNLLSAYATTRSDGTLRVLLINKNPTATISAQVTLGAYFPSSTVTTYTYGITQDNATKNNLSAALQGVAASSFSGAMNTTTVRVPPYSVTAYVFTPLRVSHLGPQSAKSDR
jgi:hypothetical protein